MPDYVSRRRREIHKRIKQIQRELVTSGQELQDVMNEWTALAKEDGLLAFLAALFNCYTRLVQRTPVDTGRARAGWHIESREDEWKPPDGDYKGQISRRIAEEIGKLPALTRADVIYVMSNIEYILPLEAGWSKQSSGFWALFIEELRSQLEQAAQRSRTGNP